MKVDYGISKDIITFPLNFTIYLDEGYGIMMRVSIAFLCFYLDFLFPYTQEEEVMI